MRQEASLRVPRDEAFQMQYMPLHAVCKLHPIANSTPVTHAKVQLEFAPALPRVAGVNYTGIDTYSQFLTLISWPSRSVFVDAIL